MLLNLSNHPYASWSLEQQEAAVPYGECIDMPFPAIEALGDEEYIHEMVVQYSDKIISLSEKHSITVHVMGEMTFSFALIELLLMEGIRCIASTSERISKETANGHKEVYFQFQQFREYRIYGKRN